MNKILIELHIAAVNKTVDVYIPLHLNIGDVLKMLSAVMDDLCEGSYSISGKEVLCMADSGAILDVDSRVIDSGLRNGSKIFII